MFTFDGSLAKGRKMSLPLLAPRPFLVRQAPPNDVRSKPRDTADNPSMERPGLVGRR